MRYNPNKHTQLCSVRFIPQSNLRGAVLLPLPMFKTLRLLSLPLLLCSCVILPRTTEVYNADCKYIAKQSELKPIYVTALGGCKDEQCAGVLVFAGAATAISAVISGSIVMVENIVYWLEKPEDCDEAISDAK